MVNDLMVYIDAITNFFESLSVESIAIWQDFLGFPIIREFILALVLVCIFGGLLKLLVTF